MSDLNSGESSPDAMPSPNPKTYDQLPLRVREHLRRMQQVASVLTVCILALRQQNAELDEDIACTLDRHASHPLDVELDSLEFYLEAHLAQCEERALPSA